MSEKVFDLCFKHKSSSVNLLFFQINNFFKLLHPLITLAFLFLGSFKFLENHNSFLRPEKELFAFKRGEWKSLFNNFIEKF